MRKRDAEKALNAVKRTFKGWYDGPEDGPQLVKDWDWVGPTPYAIVWEGGPYDWAMLASGGGRDEVGAKVEPIRVDGVFLEPVTGWALGVYPG
jgi:hypothetical protein